MKYNVSCVVNDREYETTVSVRSDATISKLFYKCAMAMCDILWRAKEIFGYVQWNYDKPNIWTNGAVGALWIEEPFINISVIREDGCCIAL